MNTETCVKKLVSTKTVKNINFSCNPKWKIVTSKTRNNFLKTIVGIDFVFIEKNVIGYIEAEYLMKYFFPSLQKKSFLFIGLLFFVKSTLILPIELLDDEIYSSITH